MYCSPCGRNHCVPQGPILLADVFRYDNGIELGTCIVLDMIMPRAVQSGMDSLTLAVLVFKQLPTVRAQANRKIISSVKSSHI